MQPCPSAYECLGNICLPRGDGGSADGGGVDAKSGSASGPVLDLGAFTATQTRIFQSPCGIPRGLAYMAGSLWCGDNGTRRYVAFAPGSSSSKQLAPYCVPSASVIDMVYDPTGNRLLALMTDYNLCWIKGSTAQKVGGLTGRISLAWWKGKVLSFAGTTMYLHDPFKNLAQVGSMSAGSSCLFATADTAHLFRYCSTGSSSPPKHKIWVDELSATSVKKVGVYTLPIDFNQVAGMAVARGAPSRLYVIGAGGKLSRSVVEYTLNTLPQ